MTLYRVKVQAAAKLDQLVAVSANVFHVRVRAKPENGKANLAVLALLARHLGVAPKRLRIIKGATSPNKIVTLLGAG